MIRRTASFPSHVAFKAAALCCLLLLLPTALRAQRGVSPAAAARIRDQEMQDREYALYHAGESREHSEAPPPARNVLPKIREDFRQLQLVNNGMMAKVVTARALDYEFIAQSVGELNKRAERLKDNLALPQIQATGDGEPKAKLQDATPDAAQLKASLFELDRLIMSFVTNPQFGSANTLVVTHADQAGRDLRDIIELSRAIKKTAQRLGKQAADAK